MKKHENKVLQKEYTFLDNPCFVGIIFLQVIYTLYQQHGGQHIVEFTTFKPLSITPYDIYVLPFEKYGRTYRSSAFLRRYAS